MSEPKRRTTQPGMGAVTPTPPPASPRASRTTQKLAMDREEHESRRRAGSTPAFAPSESLERELEAQAEPLVPSGRRGISCPSPTPPPPERDTKRSPTKWEPEEPVTATKRTERRKRSSRPPLRVDDVGSVAVKIASGFSRSATPKLRKSRSEIARAPIDHHEAFVLSLVDGVMNVQSLVDIAGMPEADVLAIVDRLARLGIISLG